MKANQSAIKHQVMEGKGRLIDSFVFPDATLIFRTSRQVGGVNMFWGGKLQLILEAVASAVEHPMETLENGQTKDLYFSSEDGKYSILFETDPISNREIELTAVKVVVSEQVKTA